MKNISINKEPINLSPNESYIIIDAQYLENIGAQIMNLDVSNIEREIRDKVFPYTDTPFTKYKAQESIFSIEKIKKALIETSDIQYHLLFSSDTSIILFIAETIFTDFLKGYSYEELVDSISEINYDYWIKHTQKYDPSDTAIILSPGISQGLDFDGSGIYQIVP